MVRDLRQEFCLEDGQPWPCQTEMRKSLDQKDVELAVLRAALYELSPLHPLVFVLGEEVEARRERS